MGDADCRFPFLRQIAGNNPVAYLYRIALANHFHIRTVISMCIHNGEETGSFTWNGSRRKMPVIGILHSFSLGIGYILPVGWSAEEGIYDGLFRLCRTEKMSNRDAFILILSRNFHFIRKFLHFHRKFYRMQQIAPCDRFFSFQFIINHIHSRIA